MTESERKLLLELAEQVAEIKIKKCAQPHAASHLRALAQAVRDEHAPATEPHQ